MVVLLTFGMGKSFVVYFEVDTENKYFCGRHSEPMLRQQKTQEFCGKFRTDKIWNPL